MRRYLSLLLFIGLVFWSCESQTIEGKWTYNDVELIDVHMYWVSHTSDLCDSIAFMDSIISYFDNYSGYGNTMTFDSDSVCFNDCDFWGKFNYSLNYPELTIGTDTTNYELNGDVLKLESVSNIPVVVSRSMNNYCSISYRVNYWEIWEK